MSDLWSPQTQALHLGHFASDEGEHSEPIVLTSGYDFPDAATGARRFANEEPGNIYGRLTNPTVRIFEKRLAALEGGEDALASATGMAAITTLILGFLKTGDHIVASASLFGSTMVLLNTWMSRLGIHTTFVPLKDNQAWQEAVQSNTKLFLMETPSNPLIEMGDIAQVAHIAHQAGAILAVDNCFSTPILQQPLQLGADVVIHSATKYIDGQGRALGGALVGKKDFVRGELFSYLRTAGPSMSPFNAWIFLKGLETLKIRMHAHSDNALALAKWLEAHPRVESVLYPGLTSYPQYQLAQAQMTLGGGMLSFRLKDADRAATWQVMDNLKLFKICANLGDTKSIVTHPASTTHARISQAERDAAGIGDNLIRLSVGLEDIIDLQNDLAQALGQSGV